MFTVYFAGDLFDQKHITGNWILARQIEKHSGNRFTCLLPQDIECGQNKCEIDIRNRDIQAIVESDVVLFNFDGADVDSGTAVEYVIAKMLDIPSVILRTDCRRVIYAFGEDWNLMMSGFPRCVPIKHSALALYNEVGLEKTHQKIAEAIIAGFERVMKEQSLLKSYKEILMAYNFVLKMCGGKLKEMIPQKFLSEIVTKKIEKNIYQV